MEAVIRLSESEVEQLTAYLHGLQKPPQIESGSWGAMLFSRMGAFPDGSKISLDVVHDHDHGVICQGVLYNQDGLELGCTDRICRLLEDIQLQSNGLIYIARCELIKN